jgi:hypothetical protein
VDAVVTSDPSDEYIRFDQFEDVVASVELVARLAPLPDDNSSRCKWTIVAAHSALQGAMVCALFDPASYLERVSKKTVQQAARSGVPPEWIVEDRLAKFGILLERCIAGNPFCDPLELTSKQQENINELNSELRNNFLHFAPLGWSIHKAILSPMICTALDAVETLMRREQVANRLTDAQQTRLAAALQTTRAALYS